MPGHDPYVDEIAHLLEGSVDSHMHTAPDTFARHDTDFSAARRARDRGMRAIVIKTHHFETASRAWLAREETGFDVLGGMTLNDWIGGLNPTAIDGLAHYEPSIVWLPTISAANHLRGANIEEFKTEEGGQGIEFLDDDGDLREAVYPVLDRIAAHDLVLATGHVSTAEAFAVVEAGREAGIEEFVVTHPFADFLQYGLEEMRQMADLGATLEFLYVTTTPRMGEAATVADMAEAIAELGADHAIVATDAGSTENEPAIEMFMRFIHELLDEGVSEAEIRTMIAENPRRIFSLE